MIDSIELLKAAKLIADAAPEDCRKNLIQCLNMATLIPVNEDGTIVEISYADYQRPDFAQNQVGPVGVLEDADLCPLEILLFWDRNKMPCEIEIIRQGNGPVIKPDFSSMALSAKSPTEI